MPVPVPLDDGTCILGSCIFGFDLAWLAWDGMPWSHEIKWFARRSSLVRTAVHAMEAIVEASLTPLPGCFTLHFVQTATAIPATIRC